MPVARRFLRPRNVKVLSLHMHTPSLSCNGLDLIGFTSGSTPGLTQAAGRMLMVWSSCMLNSVLYAHLSSFTAIQSGLPLGGSLRCYRSLVDDAIMKVDRIYLMGHLDAFLWLPAPRRGFCVYETSGGLQADGFKAFTAKHIHIHAIGPSRTAFPCYSVVGIRRETHPTCDLSRQSFQWKIKPESSRQYLDWNASYFLQSRGAALYGDDITGGLPVSPWVSRYSNATYSICVRTIPLLRGREKTDYSDLNTLHADQTIVEDEGMDEEVEKGVDCDKGGTSRVHYFKEVI
ncbi:hypothetical protein EV426DRAFT_570778 [Tirmania nivea]|nr:hypothetical protein EV426DRAFT_570778 [Tirmania nivea]